MSSAPSFAGDGAFVRGDERIRRRSRIQRLAAWTGEHYRCYGSGVQATVGRFLDHAAEARFRRAFKRAMAVWPEREDRAIETSFGRTVVSIARGRREATPVLLLPGGGSTIATWGPFASAWSKDRTVVAVDTIWDAGRSVQTKPVRDSTEVAAWLDETLTGLSLDDVHVVGFSYGAWVALNQLAHSPTRLRSVTAIEPPGTITGIPWRTWLRMLRALSGDQEQYRSYLAWVRGGRMPEPQALELLLASKREFVQRGTPRPKRLTKAQWRAAETPLTVLLAGRSEFIPARAAGIVRRNVPSAHVKVLPRASHALLVDEPETVVRHVSEFLRSNDGPRHG